MWLLVSVGAFARNRVAHPSCGVFDVVPATRDEVEVAVEDSLAGGLAVVDAEYLR